MSERQLNFDDLRLQPGQKLQLDIADYGTTRDNSTLLGYCPGQSIIVASPIQNGAPVQIMKDTDITVRFFSHKHNGAGAFRCRALYSTSQPYPHLHLTIPDSVLLGEVRRAMRAKVELGAVLILDEESDTSEKMTANITDISVMGARLERLSDENILASGDRIQVYTKVKVSDIVCRVKVKGVVRNVSLGKQGTMLGVEFTEVDDSTRVLLHGFALSQVLDQL